MRPIQFRTFDKKNKLIAYFDLWTWQGRMRTFSVPYVLETLSFDCVQKQLWFDFNLKPEEYELMQFTWLLDKNGKEIYESDIVIGFRNEERAPRYEVYFDEEILAYFLRNTKAHLHLCDLREIEIIWNIYQNSDLLK